MQRNFLNKKNLEFFELVRDKTSTLSIDHNKIPFEQLKKEHLDSPINKKIFIINEDGFGDDIMFARYIIFLKKIGFKHYCFQFL